MMLLAVCLLLGGSTPGSAQLQFVDVAPQLGLDETGTCGMLFWYDYDNDTDLDLLQPHRFYEQTYIFRNDGDHFTRLDDIGLPENWDAGYSIPMDFDHDGDFDLFFPCYHTNSLMLVNEGGQFVDRTSDLGLPQINGSRYQLWVDFDHDGFMDILFGHYIEGFKLFRNIDGTQFEDVTDQTDVPPLNTFHSVCEADVDLDGDMDMFFTSIDSGDRFYINQGMGVFTDYTVESGLSAAVGRGGCVWVDVDNDKYPDLLTQGNGKHTIWHNDGNDTFTEMNVHGTETDFGDVWPYSGYYAVADFDMNGLYDFYCCRPGGCGINRAPNQFFECDSIVGMDIWFHDVAPALGMDFEEDGVPTVADFDGDGALDLMVTLQEGPNHLYRNLSTRSANNLQVRVLGTHGEQDCWHSRVVVSPHGSMNPIGSSELNSSNVARNSFKNYFVADANGHFDVRVYFPDGTVMGPEQYPALSDVVPSQVNHLLTVYKGVQATAATDKPALAVDFGLDGAYPNPFNATTTISYRVPRDGAVTLEIFDITGRHVTNLINGPAAQGVHSVRWTAANQASGIYLAQLRCGGQSAQQKLILLK
jgi:hypothetical protein